MPSVNKRNLDVSVQLFGLRLTVAEYVLEIDRSWPSFVSKCEYVTNLFVSINLGKTFHVVVVFRAPVTGLAP